MPPQRSTAVCVSAKANGSLLAGQITGVEGYMESTAMGCVAALNAAALVDGGSVSGVAEGDRYRFVAALLEDAEPKHFQPMNMNLGIMPKPEGRFGTRPSGANMSPRRLRRPSTPFSSFDEEYGLDSRPCEAAGFEVTRLFFLLISFSENACFSSFQRQMRCSCGFALKTPCLN